MSVSIRLKKMGKKDQPFYRLVVADTLKKREGAYIENLGWYNPLVEGDNFKIDQERVEYWLSKGARISDTAKNLLTKARKGGGVAVAAAPAPAPVAEPEAAPEAPAPEAEASVESDEAKPAGEEAETPSAS